MFPQLSEREVKWEFVRTGRVRNVEQVVQFLLDSPPNQVRTFQLLYSFLLRKGPSLTYDRLQPPTWFLPPIVAQAPPTASATKSKAKYVSLIERLGLQEQAKQQDQEYASKGVDGQTASTDKGKSTDRRALDEWRSMTMQEKKAKVVLDARR